MVQPSKQSNKHAPKSRGKQDSSQPPKAKTTPRGQRDKRQAKPHGNYEEDFPQLKLPVQHSSPKPKEETMEKKEEISTATSPQLVAPPPGNFQGPQIFPMGTTASATATPKSLKAVEKPLTSSKETSKEKEQEGSDVGQLATHLQQMMLSGEISLPSNLQQAVMQLQERETEQPREPSMFSLENQRRKWQKRLTQHQETLSATHAAWTKFIAEVTQHIANKETQYYAIKLKAEQGIEEATTKLGEVAQAMQEQIPKEGETKMSPDLSEQDNSAQMKQLQSQLHRAQELAVEASAQLVPQGNPSEPQEAVTLPVTLRTPVVELDQDSPVSIQSQVDDDMHPWEEVRHRSRSRQESANKEDAEPKSKQKRRPRTPHPHPNRPHHPGKKK